MIKLAVLIGTRPEAIKMAPVLINARKTPYTFQTKIILTGQHKGMAKNHLQFFGIIPDIELNIMQENQQPLDVLRRVIYKLDPILSDYRPDVLLVQGDTTSTLAGAITAFHKKIRVGHVEAGLRTGNLYEPFPEELNRLLVSRIACYNFAPTESAKTALQREGIDPHRIWITGNTVIDALLWASERVSKPSSLFGGIPENATVILITCHRRENQGDGILSVCKGLRLLIERSQDLHVVFPVHPNPDIHQYAEQELSNITILVILLH